MILDVRGTAHRLRVEPGRVLVPPAVHHQGVVAGLALPRAEGAVAAVLKVGGVHRGAGKVVVSLDHDGVLALGDDRPVPDCLGHGVSPRVKPEMPGAGRGVRKMQSGRRYWLNDARTANIPHPSVPVPQDFASWHVS